MAYWAQKTALTWRIAFLFSVSLFSFSCTQGIEKETLPYYNTPDFTPIFVSDAKLLNQQITHQIANFSFKNQNNQTITQANIEGKIHIADFFFTSCGSICPKMTNNMKKVDSAFTENKNIVLLSYSVTPWLDSVRVLKDYAARYQIKNPNWHLLTGSKSEIYTLARRSYFAEEDLGFTKDSSNFLHTEHFLLIDKNKRIRGIYNGTLALEIEQLIKDVKTLEKAEM
jgi:protein SCO1/2